ncbi:MAG: hypothetical protein WC289_01530 [Patescibacteria group bacterium]|jgi:nanoRNase/pAp phosphatase (c-di-AMP/oligoRNAs hydrolase)
MQTSPIQQSVELITRSQSFLIALPSHPTTDAVAAGLGLFLTLEKLGKKAKVVCSEFDLPPHHQFLPKSKEIHTNMSAIRKFVITVDVARTPVDELSYDIVGDKLNIFLTPKSGFFEARDITTSPSNYEYDAIVVIDAPDLDALGKLYQENAEFFYHTPIINIDHSPSNEQYGQINPVDLVATSSSEIVFELCKALGTELLDEYIATNLLTGIISKTKSFQTATVTPRSLSIASHLIEQGARRDDIIKNLYRTKSIETLKLWGRALARLRTNHGGRVVWSVLNRQDFERSGADEQKLDGVIDELIVNTPQAELIVVIYEKSDQTIGVIASTTRSLDGFMVFRNWKPQGTKNYMTFTLPGISLTDAEKQVLDAINTHMDRMATQLPA